MHNPAIMVSYFGHTDQLNIIDQSGHQLARVSSTLLAHSGSLQADTTIRVFVKISIRLASWPARHDRTITLHAVVIVVVRLVSCLKKNKKKS